VDSLFSFPRHYKSKDRDQSTSKNSTLFKFSSSKFFFSIDLIKGVSIELFVRFPYTLQTYFSKIFFQGIELKAQTQIFFYLTCKFSF